jgi:flagellar biogenesis protein FliO
MGFGEQLALTTAVMAVFGASLWWLKRKGIINSRIPLVSGKSVRRLQMLECLPVAPQHALHLVQVGDRVVLIGRSPSGLSLLGLFDSQLCRGNGAGAREEPS